MKMAARRVHARLFGVLGAPVDHSLSPAMQNAAFAAARLPHLYLRYRVAPPALEEALADARRLRMGGLNLTVPLKETALPLCDVLTAEARRIGAVNTLLFRRGRLADAALVVNPPSLALGRARLALRHGASPPSCLFVDLVYGTQPTPFLAAAVRAGRATLDGGPMLLHQGALAFETWTGRRAPLAAMAGAPGDAVRAMTQPRASRTLPPPLPPRP